MTLCAALLLSILGGAQVFAQSGYEVKGVVVDAVGPIIGATVIEQGTTNGVSTGLDGDYVLTVSSADAIVEISCIGYATQTFVASQVPATVTLGEDTEFLDEVVVIGYGTVKKEDMTGSITAIKSEELNRGALTSPQELLRGKVPGVNIVSGNGAPGAGAEILCDEVRKAISPAKPDTQAWLDVMHEAHLMNLPTSATMMYGHIETSRQRIDHLLTIRDLQARCPEGNWGFIAFIPWIFRSTGTRLEREGVVSHFSPLEYVRLIAVSRLILNNIRNIQASWLTVGKATAQLTLHAGANDMGSIMIEENVVSSAGAHNEFDAEGIQKAIREAGFEPRLRDQLYRLR